MEEPTKYQRIANLNREIDRLKSVHRGPDKKEILTVCVEALEDRIDMIVGGED